MFGYVKVNSAELKVKEYEFYRGTYCGLCRSMGKCTGNCSRMMLSYDFVFLALVRLALEDVQPEFEQRRCFVHPLKKRNSMKRNTVLDYCAAAASIMNYRKVADDLHDEHGTKRLKAFFAKPFVSHARKKALRRNPELECLDKTVADDLTRLNEIETANCRSADIPADIFGHLLGCLMSYGFSDTNKKIAFEIGKSVGAWIYIADAIDDMSDDSKKERYNPILRLYGGKIPNIQELELIMCGLKNKLLNAGNAFDLVDFANDSVKNIIANILFIGIPDRTESIIKNQNNEYEGKEDHND